MCIAVNVIDTWLLACLDSMHDPYRLGPAGCLQQCLEYVWSPLPSNIAYFWLHYCLFENTKNTKLNYSNKIHTVKLNSPITDVKSWVDFITVNIKYVMIGSSKPGQRSAWCLWVVQYPLQLTSSCVLGHFLRITFAFETAWQVLKWNNARH